ncbi:MAG: coenzyme F420-0:L-glutamate ligase [Candidatus Moranbacteria bacterium]|jgi:F420-0:gamma-glutamyl ligase|nr:coenzyme F420-0:L-glutamate ligase [Patescibacteria group bacterium]MBP6975572.1 coenzyme F420-0:L-glutamate ligase [Candidatus Moranbacteria bacterium]
MIVTPLKTDIVLPEEQSLLQFLDRNLTRFPEHSILAISAKVIALCEGRTADLSVDKESLIEAEADYFLPKEYRRFGASGTIIHHAFIGAAGIDESNAAGTYVLLPKDPQQTAGAIYNALKKRFAVDRIGVLITDSHSTPMRRGASGVALAYRGFVGLRDYRGKPDLFGRKLIMEQANLPDALACAAVLTMGEGDEQTPLALIEGIPHITFDETAPTKEELSQFFVNLEDDIFAPLINFQHLKKTRSRDTPLHS